MIKFKDIKYTIVEQNFDFFVRIDTFYFGFHLVSEVLTDGLGNILVFADFYGAKERVNEILNLKSKETKKKLKLLKKC